MTVSLKGPGTGTSIKSGGIKLVLLDQTLWLMNNDWCKYLITMDDIIVQIMVSWLFTTRQQSKIIKEI
jgi:hypothetical protein